jgi:hypothetical protein
LTSLLAGDVPELSSARVGLEQRGGQALIVLTTPYPINEPALRVAVRIGCRMPVAREYTVLLDPVTIQPPVAQMAANATQDQADGRAPSRAAISSAQSATTLPEARPVQRRVTPQKRAAAAPHAQPATGIGTTTQAATSQSATLREAPKGAGAARLHISRMRGDRAPAPKGVAPTAAAQREALAAIEEQTVVLKRQLAELELAMQQVREQLAAAKAARAAAETAVHEEAAPTAARDIAAARIDRGAKERATEQAAMREVAQRIAPPTLASKLAAWAADNAVFILVILLVALAAALALSIRRRQPVLIPAPRTAAQAESFNRADLGEPSVPGFPMVSDDEALVRLAHERARGHMIPPVFVDPIAVVAQPEEPPRKPSGFTYDPALSFDWEVQKHLQGGRPTALVALGGGRGAAPIAVDSAVGACDRPRRARASLRIPDATPVTLYLTV